MILTAYIIPLLIVYLVAKKCWVSYVTTKYRYKFYALRDEIRGLVIDKRVAPDDAVVTIFDQLWSLEIGNLEELSLWPMVYSHVFIQDHLELQEKLKQLLYLSVERNKSYLPSLQKFINIHSGYLIEKSIVSFSVAAAAYYCIKFFSDGVHLIDLRFANLREYINHINETSFGGGAQMA